MLFESLYVNLIPVRERDGEPHDRQVASCLSDPDHRLDRGHISHLGHSDLRAPEVDESCRAREAQ